MNLNLNALKELQRKTEQGLEEKLAEMQEIDPEKAEEMRQVLALAKEGKVTMDELPNIIKKWQ